VPKIHGFQRLFEPLYNPLRDDQFPRGMYAGAVVEKIEVSSWKTLSDLDDLSFLIPGLDSKAPLKIGVRLVGQNWQSKR